MRDNIDLKVNSQFKKQFWLWLFAGCFVASLQANKIELFVNQLNQQVLVKEKNLSITEDQPFMLTVAISGDDVQQQKFPSINVAGLENFDIATASQGKAQHCDKDGQSYSSYDYHYYLQPKRSGRFKIGPATCNIDDTHYKSSTINVVVQPQAELKDFFASAKFVASAQKSSTEVSQLFVGQKVLVALTVYANKNTFDSIEDLFVVEPESSELEFGKQTHAVQLADERRGNKVYNVRQYFFPVMAMQAGDLAVMPFKIVYRVARRNNYAGWGSFSFYSLSDITCYSDEGKPKSIEARAIPEQAQAVGSNFLIKLQLNKSRFDLGEPITLLLDIAGNGDFEKIVHPELELPENVRSYQSSFSNIAPTRKEQADGIETIKRFEFVLQPSESGLYKIPAQSFCFFDVNQAALKTVHSEAISFFVLPDGNATTTPAAPKEKKTVEPTSPINAAAFSKMQQFGFVQNYTASTVPYQKIGFLLLVMIGLILLLLLFFYELKIWLNVKLQYAFALLRAKRALRRAQKEHNFKLIYDIVLTFLALRFESKKESLNLENIADLIKILEQKKQQAEFMDFLEQAAALSFGTEKFTLQQHEVPKFFEQTVNWLMLIDAAYQSFKRK